MNYSVSLNSRQYSKSMGNIKNLLLKSESLSSMNWGELDFELNKTTSRQVLFIF